MNTVSVLIIPIKPISDATGSPKNRRMMKTASTRGEASDRLECAMAEGRLFVIRRGRAPMMKLSLTKRERAECICCSAGGYPRLDFKMSQPDNLTNVMTQR